MKKKATFETFNDGIVNIYKLNDVSEPGMKPNLKPDLHKKCHFGYRTIGVKRHYEAAQAQVRLDEMIQIPIDRAISTQDIAVIQEVQYNIKQVQHKMDTMPKTSLLSLTILEAYYDGL